MLLRSATWAHCIFGEDAFLETMHRPLNGFARRPKADMRLLNRSLHGCISREPVYLRTTESQRSGCNWPRTRGMLVHKWTWDVSTSKVRAYRLTILMPTFGTKRQGPEESSVQSKDSEFCRS